MSENNIGNEKKSPLAKAFSIICTVLTVILIALTAVVAINLIVSRVKNRPVSFFGASFAIVQTNSMEPEIMVGDLVVYMARDYADIKVGDNIVFIADENFPEDVRNENIIHKVVEITEDGIVTRGVHNSGPDGGLREKDEIRGVCTFHSSGWGKVFNFVGKYGIFILILLVAIPFIVRQVIKIVKLAKNGGEEGEAITAESDGYVSKSDENMSKNTEILSKSDENLNKSDEPSDASDDGIKSETDGE